MRDRLSNNSGGLDATLPEAEGAESVSSGDRTTTCAREV